MTSNIKKSTVYVIEGWIADPNNPKWLHIALSAINGWQGWRNHPNRARQGIYAYQFADCLAFDDKDAAFEAFNSMCHIPQTYKLRLVRLTQTEQIEVVGKQLDYRQRLQCVVNQNGSQEQIEVSAADLVMLLKETTNDKS